MSHKISIKVNSEFNTLDEILLWFEQLNHPPISEQVIWWQCQTLLQEGFANVVEHAHKNLPPQTHIFVEAERCNQYIEILIWSVASNFNLEQKLREIPELEDNESDGGRGLKIMEEYADELSYECKQDNRACLRMRKYY
ncbi:MAG TPA: ATP-binding protein [Cyanobacteria bacterium UBA11049]|nr:ATP-binding protein [Cyanobacteria bacterium UBA11049]